MRIKHLEVSTERSRYQLPEDSSVFIFFGAFRATRVMARSHATESRDRNSVESHTGGEAELHPKCAMVNAAGKPPCRRATGKISRWQDTRATLTDCWQLFPQDWKAEKDKDSSSGAP